MRAGTLENMTDHRLHLRVIRLAEIPQSGGKIPRPDKDAVNALNASYRIQVIDPLLAFDLHQHRNLLVDLGEIVRHGAVTIAAV
ncbi:hypothetical protein D3C75_1091380 [compost metagenome]